MHTRDLVRFLQELSENNNRAWFVMNKPRYDILREEFLQLVTGLIADIGKFDPDMRQCDPKKAMFRINRDVRFSADKSPYKTHFSAALLPSGRKKPSEGGGPAYYFHVDANGHLYIAAGEYMPPADRLAHIRQGIVKDTAGFSKTLKNANLKKTFGDLQQEHKLSRPPKGYDADAPHIEYLKLKSFFLGCERKLADIDAAELHKTVLEGFKHAWPMVQWLRNLDAILPVASA